MHIELLAPAGSPEALDAAVGEGADAVYLGLKNFNARIRSANFSYGQFEAALRSLRRMGKKIYLTVNTVFEQREADRMYQLLKYLNSLEPDALIVQDFGVVAMVRAEFPRMKMHASTQMNIAGARGANALSRRGVSRVVLARELSFEELGMIRAETNVEMEVFVHGALCVSASGLCLFSSYLGGKSANRGMCTQACRRLYKTGASDNTGAVIQEGYFFSPSDLQLLEQLPALASIGINAVKIEGRMKSADYVGTVTAAYRKVIDAIAEGGDEKIRLSIRAGQQMLKNDFARSKTVFYFNPKASLPDWINPNQDGGTGIFLGTILKTKKMQNGKIGFVCNETGDAEIIPASGDSVRLHRADDSRRVSHKLQYAETAGAAAFWLSLPEGFGKRDRVYLIQKKSRSKRYKPVISSGKTTGEKRGPGFDAAPQPEIVFPVPPKQKAASKSGNAFPEGLYTSVSSINDLYIIQSVRPEKAILQLTGKNADSLLKENSPPLPFKPADMILALNPYFPQKDDERLSRIIPRLADLGYTQFIVNNPGHFSLFRDFRQEVQLIAGPWLYIFNTWALSFIASLGADAFIPPLENNRQNLERTMDSANSRDLKNSWLKSKVFIPVFAWPPLFQIRPDFQSMYDFKRFQDSRDENFRLVCGFEKPGAAIGCASWVIPEKPFSITDKIPFLKQAGYKRFIIDFGGMPVKKTDYKTLMRHIDNNTPIPQVSRFNWKDGFFQNEE